MRRFFYNLVALITTLRVGRRLCAVAEYEQLNWNLIDKNAALRLSWDFPMSDSQLDSGGRPSRFSTTAIIPMHGGSGQVPVLCHSADNVVLVAKIISTGCAAAGPARLPSFGPAT